MLTKYFRKKLFSGHLVYFTLRRRTILGKVLNDRATCDIFLVCWH